MIEVLNVKLVPLRQKLNYDKIVRGSDLDLDTYNQKFAMWDYVLENDLLAKGAESERLEAVRLLNDPTIYQYAFFKDDEDKPFKYTAYQDAIANCHHDFTADNLNRYLLFVASNQIGKSRWLIGQACFHAFTGDNVNIVIISKSLPQSQFLLANFRHALNNSAFRDSWRSDVGETANTTIMTFTRPTKDGGEIVNRVICAPAGEGALGYPVHYLYLDEADFYDDAKTFFWKVAFARTKKTKGQIILFSNPNPELARINSLLWELWNGDLFKRKFTFNFLDAPWNTQEEYDRDKRNAPSFIFASTHDGCFPEEGGGFLSESEIRDMMFKDWNNVMPAVDRPVFIALDLGKMRDQTVLSIGITKKPENKDDKYMDLDVKYLEEFPLKTSYDRIADRLVEVKKYYEDNYNGVACIGFDATGQKTFGDFLKRKGVQAVEVDFSKKETNKTKLYNDFKLMAENRKIRVVYTYKCERQLAGLQFKLTEGKKLKKVEAKTEDLHDDYPDSLVILIAISVKISAVEASVTIASKPGPNEELESEFEEIWGMMGLKKEDKKMMSHFDERRKTT